MDPGQVWILVWERGEEWPQLEQESKGSPPGVLSGWVRVGTKAWQEEQRRQASEGL